MGNILVRNLPDDIVDELKRRPGGTTGLSSRKSAISSSAPPGSQR